MNAQQLRWVKAPQHLRETTGLQQSARAGDALEVGIFHARYGTDRWRVLPRKAGDSWGYGLRFGTKRDAIAQAEKHYGGRVA